MKQFLKLEVFNPLQQYIFHFVQNNLLHEVCFLFILRDITIYIAKNLLKKTKIQKHTKPNISKKMISGTGEYCVKNKGNSYFFLIVCNSI